MKAYVFGIALISASLSLFLGCEKEEPGDISIQLKLLDQFGIQKNEFENGDSLIIEFYLSNFTGRSVEYLRPCGEFKDYFSIYRENSSGNYEYYGRPDYHCVLDPIFMTIDDQETTLLNRIPWSTKPGWPDIEPGKYYVGDTLSLRINGEAIDFMGRIHFEILLPYQKTVNCIQSINLSNNEN